MRGRERRCVPVDGAPPGRFLPPSAGHTTRWRQPRRRWFHSLLYVLRNARSQGALLEAAMVRNIVLPFGAAGSNNKRQ